LRAQTLAAQFASDIAACAWESRSDVLRGADLLVNATSLGMVGQDALSIDLAHLPPSAIVTDIVYTPLLTPLLEQAKKNGNAVVDGLGMLLHQAVPGFTAWFGTKPVVDHALRQYVLKAGQ
jgi:shikimate dehydrogenase